MSLVVNLDYELTEAAIEQANTKGCSVSQQIEEWAWLGKVLEEEVSEEVINLFLKDPRNFKIVLSK